MTTILPSSEQQKIVKKLKYYNIVVNSVAGSGKTTTNLFIAKKYPDQNILLLTYNKKLSFETKERIKKSNLNNISVFTYHAFCCTHYVDSCKNDAELENFLDGNIPVKKSFSYDIIILDEAQDITLLLYKLVCKVYSDNSVQFAKLCILGDTYQSIYEYNGADCRYIKLAGRIYNFGDRKWKKINLSQSYRVTKQMCNFINDACLHKNRIKSEKKGKWNPIIMLGSPFDSIPGKIFDLIMDCIENQNYNEEDIFILAPSIRVKQTHPLNQLANKLTLQKYAIHMPTSDDETIDSDNIKNKILFSSYHQAKGMERKIAVVLSFDESYFDYYARDHDPKKMSNPQYVALTRGSEILVLQADSSINPCQFLNIELAKKFANILPKDKVSMFKMNVALASKVQKKQFRGVVNHVRSMSHHFYKQIIKLCELATFSKKSEIIHLKSKIKQGNLCESVSELNGEAIPIYYWYLTCTGRKGAFLSEESLFDIKYDKVNTRKKFGDFNIVNQQVEEYIVDQRSKRINTTSKRFGKCLLDYDNTLFDPTKQKSVSQILYIVSHYNSLRDNVLCKIHQIVSYDWISNTEMLKCIKRLKKYISPEAKYEQKIVAEMNKNTDFNGYMDIVDGDTIWR